MKRLCIPILLIGFLMVVACGKATSTPFDSPLPTPAAGQPNAASQYCVNQGHQLEIRTDADGAQTGYCLFADGTECEEWAYYRGECKPGKK